MKRQVVYRSNWTMAMALLLIFAIVGCTGQVAAPTTPPESSPTSEAVSPTADAAASPTEPGVEPPATSEPAIDENVLYQDDFTNPTTGWAVAEFGNYFIGYHEPESYHIEIKSPHLKAPVVTIPDPATHNYPDATIELAVQTVSGRTATDGDYRYGLAFRQTGDNYYAFTISPTTKKWEVFKSSPSGFALLKEGVEEGIQGLDVDDVLRVDMQGFNFSFYVNDTPVGQMTDSDYPEGSVGFYAENIENTNTHVHYNTLSIRKVEGAPEVAEGTLFYEDDFTNPTTGWAVAEFGNYFIGYHEPESYHIEIKSPHLKAPVVSIPDPATHNYPDATIELAVQTVAGRTATDGDYRYGLVFRQTGDNYYAFTISPTTKKWEVFKSSPSGFTLLKEGVDESIQGLDVDDLLHVDTQGSNFLFYVNDKLVGQVTDSDYPEGSVGLYAENIENTNTHVHYNTLSIREVKFSMMCSVLEGLTVYVRSGPSQTYPQIAVLSSGDTVQAKGISSTQWIQIVVEGSSDPGWVSYSEGYMSCTPSVDLFPVINP
jgi:hypothetical protein